MERSLRSAELVSGVLAQLDLELFHAPGSAVKDESGYLADRLPVGCNHGSSSKAFVRKPHLESPSDL